MRACSHSVPSCASGSLLIATFSGCFSNRFFRWPMSWVGRTGRALRRGGVERGSRGVKCCEEHGGDRKVHFHVRRPGTSPIERGDSSEIVRREPASGEPRRIPDRGSRCVPRSNTRYITLPLDRPGRRHAGGLAIRRSANTRNPHRRRLSGLKALGGVRQRWRELARFSIIRRDRQLRSSSGTHGCGSAEAVAHPNHLYSPKWQPSVLGGSGSRPDSGYGAEGTAPWRSRKLRRKTASSSPRSALPLASPASRHVDGPPR